MDPLRGRQQKSLRLLNADERDFSLGFPAGSSKLPKGRRPHEHGEEFERGSLTGNVWSPPAAAHVPGHLAKHILEGIALKTDFVLPEFVSSKATLDFLQPEDSSPARRGGERPPVAAARLVAGSRPHQGFSRIATAPGDFDGHHDAAALASGPQHAPAPDPDPATTGSTPSLGTAPAPHKPGLPEPMWPRDPTTGTPIPPKGSSPDVLEAGMRQHLEATQARALSLAADNTDIPEGISECFETIAKMTPRQLLRHQHNALVKLRAVARFSEGDDEEVLAGAPKSVRSVLSAASPGGLKVALLHKYLTFIGHGDADDFFRDLSQGFPLVGKIPVSPVAPLHEVRVPAIRADELRERAGPISESLLAQHSAAPRDAEAEKKVFSQTLEDVRLGRMGPLGTPGVDLFPPYTRRFGVSQKSSHGEVRVRCIDDFAQSLINDTVDIDRRIRMGSIADFVETARRLHAARPREALHAMKGDFQAAYRSCPIRPEDVPYASILVRSPSSGVVSVTAQWAMPFGAVSAVYGQFP